MLPALPIPCTIVITFVTYWSSLKSSSVPTVCQLNGSRLKIGPTANASAGNVNANAATPPAPCVTAVMNRRRVTVSPSNDPGICRSAVYLDFAPCVCRSAT